MTLTVSLLADGLIVQSADHRLLEIPSGKIVTNFEKKQFVVQLSGPCLATISFAGLGAVEGYPTSQLLYDTALKAGGPGQVSLDQFIEDLRRNATKWLRRVPVDNRHHSFVVAGIELVEDEVVTKVSLVSNYQTITGQEGLDLQVDNSVHASESFAVSSYVVGEPIVLVAGMHAAVPRSDRLALTRMVRNRRRTIELARRLAYINRWAALRAEDNVSPECTTAALLLGCTQINAMTRAHREGEYDVAIDVVMTGVDQRRIIEEIWHKEGMTGTPHMRGSAAGAVSLNGTTTGSSYANPDDVLLT